MRRIRRLFGATLGVAVALIALAIIVSAQEPQGGVKGLAAPRPDLMSQLQMAGRQGSSLSADLGAEEAGVAYGEYLQSKLGGKTGDEVQLKDSDPFPTIPAPVPPAVDSRVLAALVNYSNLTNNSIPQPSTENNTDFWVPNFSKAHYETLLFSTANAWSLRSYYREASYWGKPNALDLQGEVHDWATLPNPAVYYGADPISGGVDTNVLDLVRHAADTMSMWVPSGTGTAVERWAQFDKDGDGYIDYFIVVHAGKGQEAGGGALGDNAVWSGHGTLGGYAFTSTVTIPQINNFVIVPEDAPVGLLVHEMGRLFGLPATWNPASGTGVSDISWPKQDTGGSGEASPAFWDVMGQGFWLGRPLGTKPASMNAWARGQLGWLTPVTWNLAMMPASIHLDQIETTSADNQALKIELPERTYVAPHSGIFMRQAPDPTNLTSPSELRHTFQITAASSAQLRFWTYYHLEPGYDYAYVQVDAGAGWTNLAEYNGSSGGWVQRTVNLSAYVGQTVDVRFYLVRDGSVEGLGWFLDDFELVQDSVVTWSDDLESSDVGPAQGGSFWYGLRFPRLHAYTSAHYYLVEWRNDDAGFDRGLREAYNMTNLATGKAEYFGYNPGLLIWYVNPIYYRVDPYLAGGQDADNNVLWHPGEGFLLAIDAHPDSLMMAHNGQPWRTRVQMLDATFRYNPASPQTYATVLKDVGGVTNTLGPLPEVRYFWDAMGLNPYWRAAAPDNSAKTPMYGVRLEVEGENADKLGATVRFSIDGADMSQSRKSVDLATAVPGDTLEYTIVLVNTGIADAHTIVVSDAAPAGTTYAPGSYTVDGSPSWAITETNGIRWQGTVPLANPVTITFQVMIDSIIEPGIIENVAHVYEGTVPEIDLFAETYVESLPCLTSSVKTSDPTAQLAGGLVTYTIYLENTGTAQSSAIVTDSIPVCTTYVADSLYYSVGSGFYDPQTNSIYWTGLVPAGQQNGHRPYIQFTVKINPGQIPCTLISNQVTINDGLHPPFSTGANTTVLTGPNLWESAKTVDKAVAAPGEELLYTISLYNGGNLNATGVSMVDNLPANVTYVPGSLTTSAGSGAYDTGLNRVIWSGDLAVLGSAQLTFRATITSPLANGTWITNTATINQGSNVYVREAGTEVLSEPRLTNSTKTVESDAIGYGGTLTYTITLINDGTQDATVLLTDTIPAGTDYQIDSLSSTPGYSTSALASPWRIQGSGTVAAGHSVTVTFAVNITLTGTGIITNTATINDGMHPPFDVVAVTYVSGLSMVAPTTAIYCGDELIIPVRVDNVNDLQGFQVNVDFDPAVLSVMSIQQGTWFSPAAWTIKSYNNISGTSTVAAILLSQPVGKSGGGVLYNLRFRTIGSGTTPITIMFSQLSNTPAPAFTEIPHNVTSPITVTIEDRAVTGYALMQGRTDHSGVTILLNGVDYGYTTAADGSYAFCPPTGNGTSFTLKIMKNGYLYGQKTITVPTSGTIALSNLTLLGGDPIGPQITATRPATCTVTSTLTVAGPPDGKVNILDLTFVGARFGKASTDADWGPDVCNPDYLAYRADINEDNIVNIFDLVLVGNNFGAIAPSLWP